MAENPRPAMSDAERAVLKILWEHGPKTVRAVQELLQPHGPDWTRSTVITLLQRLEKKGYVHSDKSQFAYVFHAAVSREDVVHARMVELAEELADGHAAPLVMAFAERHPFTAAEIARLKAMLDDLSIRKEQREQP